MANRQKLSRHSIRKAILASDGTKTKIAEALRCSRQTLDNYLNTDTELRTLLEQQRDSILDIAESHLKQWVEEGNERAVYFLLETRGRSRGYSRRTELSGASDGSPLVFNILPASARPHEHTDDD